MTQINIIGQILDSSGYAIHTRNLSNALSKIVDVKLTSQIFQGQERALTDKEVEMIKKKEKGEINLIITHPLYWRLHTNAKRNWVFLVWEGDRIPKSFIDECLNEDIEYIFVPSKHTKEAIMNTVTALSIGEFDTFKGWKLDKYTLFQPTPGIMETKALVRYIEEKIRIIPHGVNLDLFYPKEKPKDKFRFLCNKGFRNLEDRGGIQYAIQAYMEEFNSSDNVELFLKLNPAYGIPDLNKIINELKPLHKPNLPPIRISVDNISYEKLVELYNQANVLLMPTRAESFGIPGIEAMACGLPVITTNFGGQMDYCNESNSWIIGGEMTEIKHELAYEGVSWLTPSIPELRKVMRIAYDCKDLPEKGQNALQTAHEFTWDKTAQKVKELI